MNRPALMGILNLTPDSFSDGYATPAQALLQFDRLAADGADIVDLGAESTRPGATPISPEEEWERLGPVLVLVAGRHHTVRLSVDTRHAQTAARAIDAGVAILNDVGGLRDIAMLELLAGHENDIVAMHALSIPADKALVLAEGCDPVAAVLAWKDELLMRAATHGIAPERLIFDPGIGFGKTTAQSRQLVQEASRLVASGGRWLFGHSRKSFLPGSELLTPVERDGVTRELSLQLAQAGVHYLRVHDIAGHVAVFGR